MKKFSLLLMFIFIIGCTELNTSKKNLNIDSETQEIILPERNPNCMDMNRFKVLQVFDDNHALAFECNSGEYCSSNTVVLLTPQRNIDYYDDMIVNLPNGKCAIQDGVYKYKSKGKEQKTVPVITYDYEFEAQTDEEAESRFLESLDEARYNCKLSMRQNKKTNNDKNMKKCDCAVDLMASEILLLQNQDTSNLDENEVLNNIKKKVNKKCGIMPKSFW